ncbi:hypothetical protein Tco_1137352 [Tanacetum coccineum]
MQDGFENGFKVDMYHEYNDSHVMKYFKYDNLFTENDDVDNVDCEEIVVGHEEDPENIDFHISENLM